MKKQKSPSAPRAAVGAVIIERGKVLLVKRKFPPKKGKWAVPGGSVNLGETLQAAAEREVMEETGLTVEATEPIYTFDLIERNPDGTILFHFMIADLSAKYISGTPQPADDVSDAQWFAPDEIEGLDISENTKNLLTKIGFIP